MEHSSIQDSRSREREAGAASHAWLRGTRTLAESDTKSLSADSAGLAPRRFAPPALPSLALPVRQSLPVLMRSPASALTFNSHVDPLEQEAGQSLALSARTLRSPLLGHEFSRIGIDSNATGTVRSGGPPRLQTKLTVGAPNDIYEREADRIAEHVMRMPRSGQDEGDVEATAGELSVHRKCAGCEEEEQSQTAELAVQRKCAACEEEEEHKPPAIQRKCTADERQLPDDRPAAVEQEVPTKSLLQEATQVRRLALDEEPPDPELFPEAYFNTAEATVQRASRDAHADPGSSAISEQALASGGTPMPSGLREFYEDRFRRDFNDVRVHSGTESEGYNQQLHSYAFTYGHHIWMGQGKQVEPSLLLAHELAHVVQQQQPRVLPKRRNVLPPISESNSDASRVIRPFRPYWEPYEFNGPKNHETVLGPMGKDNSIFIEAPVPNADRLSSGYNKAGIADLYGASTTVGVYFTGHNTPAALKSNPRLRKNGTELADHKGTAAPAASIQGGVERTASAPSEIKVADLKPSHGTIEALEGTGQVLNYLEGFKLAQKEVNEPGSHADGQWQLSAHLFGSKELSVPAQFAFPNFDGQASRKVVLKQFFGRPIDPKPTVFARLAVYPDPSNEGIWNYAWVPDTTPAAASLPSKVRDLLPEVDKDVVTPLVTSPLQAQAKAKPGPALAHVLPVTRDPAPVVRRKDEVPSQDNFNFGAWRESQKRVAAEFKEQKGTQDFKDAETQLQAAQAQQAMRESGLNVPEPPGGKGPAHELGKIEFWSSASAIPFGFMRQVFGPAFVKVAQLFIKARDKFRELLTKTRQAASSGGFLGAALKAAFKVLKLAISFVIGKVADRLMQSLVKGVTDKLKSLLSGEVQEELEAKVQQVQQLKDELEKKATDTVEGLLQKILGPYLGKIETLKNVYNLVSDISRLVNLVRWGARVIACLSPPAWGCLWILGQALLEKLAEKVAETCWFQKKVEPLFTGIKYLLDLPKELADVIIEKIRSFLPDSVHDVFATLDKSAVPIGADDLKCQDEEGGGFNAEPQHEELLRLQERLGEEKYQAMAELLKQYGIKSDQPLAAADISNLGDTIIASGVTAEQMRAFAQNPSASGGIPVDLKTFLDNVKAGKPGGASTQPLPTSQPATPPAGGGGQDRSGGNTGPGLDVVDAKPWNPQDPVHELPDVRGQILNASWQHYYKTVTKVDMLGYWKWEAKVVVKGVSVEVTNRKWYPPKSDENTAKYLIVYYKLLDGVDLSRLAAGAGFLQGAVIPAALKNPSAPAAPAK